MMRDVTIDINITPLRALDNGVPFEPATMPVVIMNVLEGYASCNGLTKWLVGRTRGLASLEYCRVCETRFERDDEFTVVDTDRGNMIVCRECGERIAKKLEGARL